MNRIEKIGVGIITCNRESYFWKCYESIPSYVSQVIVVNDGRKLSREIRSSDRLVCNDTNLQVGECKNIAMRYLLDAGCDYIFTCEDDIVLKEPEVLNCYIRSSLETGIEHFNFGFSQKENLDANARPVIRKIIHYQNCSIVLTPNVLGALTFYTRRALQTVGLHHYKFNKGHGDHPELTYRAWKHGFTTPFWWFADIHRSWEMIENLSDMNSDSLVRNQAHIAQNFREACDVFQELHGVHMMEVPDTPEDQVLAFLNSKRNHSL